MELRHDKLRAARERRLLTQQGLADLAGTSKANISRLESGEQKARMSTIVRLANALDIDPEELVEWTEAHEEFAKGKAAA
ncbi:MAG: helix-turn-helix transcriptional regulator [Thermomicrobiales bacterium]